MRRLSAVLVCVASLSAAVGCSSKSSAPDGGSGAGGVGGASAGSGGGAGGANGGAGGAGARGGSGGAGGSTAACAFAATYTLLDWSGPDTDDVTRLSPPSSYYYQGETGFAVDGGVSFPFCDPTAPACNSATRVDVSDVEAAIAHPDVQAALAMTTAPVFGNFTGLPDANNHLLSFSRSSGGGFNCNNDCPTPAGSCTPIPPGIKALVALLRQLKTELRADPACAGVH